MLAQRFLLVALLVWCIPVVTSAATFEVEIGDSGFSPPVLTINRGDTVRWINKGSRLHGAVSGTIASPSGIFNSGFLNPGVAFECNFPLAGQIEYFDASTPSLTGTVTVGDISLIISPASNSYLFSSHSTDIVIYSKLNSAMKNVVIRFDGVDITPYLESITSFESSKTYDAAILKISIPPYVLTEGVHTINVDITTRTDISLSSNATYTVIDTIPAPGPPPFGWPCIESSLPCN